MARAIRNAIRANRFARIIRNWNPYFYSASGQFARITRISDSRESPDSRESCESIRANHATKVIINIVDRAALKWANLSQGFTKGWFSKRVVLADVPPERKAKRGYIQMFPQNKNRKSGPTTMTKTTSGCTRRRLFRFSEPRGLKRDTNNDHTEIWKGGERPPTPKTTSRMRTVTRTCGHFARRPLHVYFSRKWLPLVRTKMILCITVRRLVFIERLFESLGVGVHFSFSRHIWMSIWKRFLVALIAFLRCFFRPTFHAKSPKPISGDFNGFPPDFRRLFNPFRSIFYRFQPVSVSFSQF